MRVSRALRVLRRLIYKSAFKGAHRYCRAINPHRIPFFLLGGVFVERYEALNWRQKRIFKGIQQRWDIERNRAVNDLAIAAARRV